ncbi:hypothetical protein LTR53_009437 [Teratosphaeriaceae sp. CCFEE 6253]|nr:hypothetical protein LTR53_009437 [Teratosphaeriaceae sp. CCFEE 6253]
MGTWGDSAISAFVNLTPSSPWAIKVAEQWKGLPFGKYIHQSPPRRRRALTGPINTSPDSGWPWLHLFASAEAAQPMHEQSESPFFAKLPLDIRMMIYELLLGGHIFHIESATPHSRIYHRACARPAAINEPDHQCHDDPPASQRPPSAPREPHAPATGLLLPLPATCRRVYAECIRTLYTANTFQFTSNHAAFRFLKTMLPPQRLRSLRHFRMIMRLPHHPHMNARSEHDWAALWAFFADEMPGLQTLYLKLLLLHDTQEQIRHAGGEARADWVRPMMRMVLAGDRARGCRVEVVTGGTVHALDRIAREAAGGDALDERDGVFGLVCMQVHERIRVSFGGDG